MQKSLKISIIIPTLNQAQFLQEAIQSIITQQITGTEILVIDGGSTDGTQKVINEYLPYIAYWVSETDRGQTHAINKGLTRITGDVWCYLNSDDLLLPDTLAYVRDLFLESPEIFWLSGAARVFGIEIQEWLLKPSAPESDLDILAPWSRKMKYVFPASVACFMRKDIPEEIGLFDENLHYSMDIEYYTRAYFSGYNQHVTDRVLGAWRWHDDSKTLREGISYGFRGDEIAIAKKYLSFLSEKQKLVLSQQIKHQEKWYVVRRAMRLKEQGSKLSAFTLLARALKRMPSLLWFRPWLGAIRRLV